MSKSLISLAKLDSIHNSLLRLLKIRPRNKTFLILFVQKCSLVKNSILSNIVVILEILTYHTCVGGSSLPTHDIVLKFCPREFLCMNIWLAKFHLNPSIASWNSMRAKFRSLTLKNIVFFDFRSSLRKIDLWPINNISGTILSLWYGPITRSRVQIWKFILHQPNNVRFILPQH